MSSLTEDVTVAPSLATLEDKVSDQWDNRSTDSCDLHLKNGEFPLILILTLAVNSVALVVLLRMRGTCDNLDHYLVLLLNVNDLITTGLFTLMWTAGWSSCNRVLRIPAFCSVFGLLASALLVLSSAIILIISSFRYLSLAKPLYYRANVTSRTVTTTAVGALVFSLLLFVFPLTGLVTPFVLYEDYHMCVVQFTPGYERFGHRVFIGCMAAFGCVVVLHVVVCNLAVARSLRKRFLLKNQNSSITNVCPSNIMVMDKRRVFAYVTIVVSFVFVLCYAPFVVRILVDCIQDVDTSEGNIGHNLSRMLLFLSPLLNPIVYGVFNKQFRLTLFSLVRATCRVGRNKVHPGVIVADR